MCLSAKRIKRKFRQATHLFYEFLPPGLFTFWSKVNIPSFKNNNTLPTNRQFNLQSIFKKLRQVASKIITNIECGESSYLHLAANKSLKPKTRHKVVRDDLIRGRHMILSIRIWTESSISAKQKLGCNMQCVHCWLLLPIQFNAPIFIAFIFFFPQKKLTLDLITETSPSSNHLTSIILQYFPEPVFTVFFSSCWKHTVSSSSPWNQPTAWHHFLKQIMMPFQSNRQLAISKTNSAATAFKTSY